MPDEALPRPRTATSPPAAVTSAPRTRPAQPKPYPGDARHSPAAPDLVRFHREFRDAGGRPMTGVATFSGQGPAVTVALVDGAVDVRLKPGTYQLHTILRTQGKRRSVGRDEVTVAS